MYIKPLPIPNMMKVHGKWLNALQINNFIQQCLCTCTCMHAIDVHVHHINQSLKICSHYINLKYIS
jgi:hypothetical protein